MLGAFVKEETGSVAVAYGALTLALTVAVVGLAVLVGSVVADSYSAIPYEAAELMPSVDDLSRALEYVNVFGV